MAQIFQSATVPDIGGKGDQSLLTVADKSLLLGFNVSNKTKGSKGVTAAILRGDRR